MKTVLFVISILIVCVVLFIKVSERSFYNSFRKRALEIRDAVGMQTATGITEKDLSGLPEPVRRYMKFTGVVGKKRMSFVHLTHSGEFRAGADRPFMPITGEYFITTKRPSFCWYGKLRMGPGIWAAAFDSYFNGKGRMFVKALSALPLVDAQSKETDNSAFGRCVAEMAMAPTFYLDRDLVKWETTGKDSARCTVTDGGFSTQAELFINPDGSPDRTVVMRYYDRGNGTATLEKFTGKASLCKPFAGFMLPTKYDGYWNLEEGDLHYVSFNVEGMEIE